MYDLANLALSSVLALLSSIILFMMKDVRSSIEKLSDRLTKLEVNTAENYIKKSDLMSITEGIVRGLK